MSKGRLEAFSDGVFAIAITLLALTLPDPRNHQHLWHYLTGNWPSYAAYLDSFLIIGIIWLNHHRLVGRAPVITQPAVLVNLGLLLFVVTIPYVTELFAEYLRAGGWDSRVAAACYSSVMLGMAVSFTGLFGQLSRAADERGHPGEESKRRAARRRFSAGQLPYLATVGLSFVSAPATLAVHFVISAYYMVDQVGEPHAPDPEAGGA